MNERKTEELVEGRLRKHGYYISHAEIVVEKQQSDSPTVQKLLRNASKRGHGTGKPEFIIRASQYSDFIIIIECKADPKKHISKTLDKYGEYAVDGVLQYASYLSKEFDVLAIAVSGESESQFIISHYFHLRGEQKAIIYEEATDIVSLEDYFNAFIHSEAKERQDYQSLLDYSRQLNNILQAKKVTEANRGFLISGILIALQNRAFQESYRKHNTSKQLARNLTDAITGQFEMPDIHEDRRVLLSQAFSFIKHSPALIDDKEFFIELIAGINENINSFLHTHKYYDTIGEFYIEFLRYANNDKGLGIVLTPRHIAELFANIADISPQSVVFDNCCGTAGLLIAAMKHMIEIAGPDKKIKNHIKKYQLYGIEYQPPIYALAVSNMILHGDGKTNIFQGDCFKDDAIKIMSQKKPTVGLLNPPYKNKSVKTDREELEYVLNNLNCLQQDGKCVAIVPITCATAPSGDIAEWKKKILKNHTLEAVMSMPIELFHNSKTTVVTCIMVFTAGRPHPKGKKTWFGYWRNDGFVKTKHRGRIDVNSSWNGIMNEWLNAFRNREIIKGMSVMEEVSYSDEWCAEAYLETDYNLLSIDMLKNSVKKLMLTKIMLNQDRN
ncbi:MAG: SAM-dependent methyltransferase [Nitrospirae bacterium YQR-1]